jgi:hypothetical protein
MAVREPRVEALARLRRRLGGGDAQNVEAEGGRPLGEGGLEGRAAQKSRSS